MSEVNEMSCDGFADIAAELALGVLTGRERAQAIVHLDGCDACMEHVRQLTVTSEKLLELLPGNEPPVGFETQVLSQLGIGRQHRSQPRMRRIPRAGWMLAAAASAVIAVAGGLSGWEMHGATARPSSVSSAPQAAMRSAALMTASRHAVGEIFLYNGNSPWMYMAVEVGSADGTVTCQLESRDGRIITVGSFRLNGGYGHWGSPVPLQAAAVTGARLTTPNGTILATATFSATR